MQGTTLAGHVIASISIISSVICSLLCVAVMGTVQKAGGKGDLHQHNHRTCQRTNTHRGRDITSY